MVNSSENLEETISTMTTIVATTSKHPPWLYELWFAIYCSFLFVWAEQLRPFAWPTRYLYSWHPQAVSLRRTDFLLFYLDLFLILAVAIFVGLRLVSRFSLTQALLRPVGGVLAVAGLPLVCLYRETSHSFFADLDLAIAAVCFLLWRTENGTCRLR